MKSFLKNSLITLFSDLMIFLFSFLSLVITSRILGPGGQGTYSLIILFPSLMITFGNVGLDSANIYFSGGKKYGKDEIFFSSLTFSFLAGLLMIAIFGVLNYFDFFKNFIEENRIPINYLWAAVISVPLSLVLLSLKGFICGNGEIPKYNKVRRWESAVQFLGILLFLLFLKMAVKGAVLAYILSIIGALILAFLIARKIISFNKLAFNFGFIKKSLIYGSKVYVANVISFLNYRLDMILIAVFLTPVAIGLYSLAVSLAEKLFLFSGAIATVLFPKISSLNKEEADDFTPKVARHTLFIMIISSFLLVIFSYPFISIFFGKAFLPSIAPLFFLLPGIIAFGVGSVLAADLSGRGKPQYAVYSSLVCLIIEVPLNLLLIPKIGIIGAALVSSISYSADTLVILAAFMNISKKKLGEVLMIGKDDLKDYKRLISSFKDLLKKSYARQ